jgi:HAD superfamily hydrolase (TIGR01509 family)
VAGVDVFGRWSPTAVVFDCDGLLMDTEPCWTVAETELFARRGLPFGVEQKELLIGRSLVDAGQTLAEVFDEPGRGPVIIEELTDLVSEVVSAQATAMPGAHELVDLVAKRVPVAVASNSSRQLLEATLRQGGFADRFAITVAVEDCARPKPAPDLYLQACERLAEPPRQTLAFEDSLTGMRSAIDAGLKLVSVPTLWRADLPGDWLLHTLADEELHEWIASWPA